MSLLTRVRGYPGLVRSLRAFFEREQTVEDAKATIRDRVARRDELFLSMARERFCTADSPYRPLLDLAQCGYRDIEVMMRQRGLEATLHALRRAGVYLTFEEFKFDAEVRRGGRVVRIGSPQLNGRRPQDVMSVRSGGTRSDGTWSPLNLEHLAATRAPQLSITLDVLTTPEVPILIWQLGFPSGAGISAWFAHARLRRPAVRWFSLTPIPRGVRRRHALAFRTAQWMAWRAGLRLPGPEFVPVAGTGRVFDAMWRVLGTSGRCVVITTPSCAVRLTAEAQRRGEGLRGVTFITGGEPLTADKAAEVWRAGARIASRYSITDAGGPVGAPCGDPAEAGDMHFLADSLAMIGVPRRFGDITVNTLMLTSLLPSAPQLLLNVEMDDFAVIEERRCGCVWDDLGCRTHLRRVRSFTKLTGEGTTLLGSNCVDILERVLPGAFGGSSVDYQLVEAEDEARLTRLYLLISPHVGPVDDAAVLRRFGEALEATATRPLGGRRVIWEQAQTIRVVRRDPIATGVGKLMPFHTLGRSAHLYLQADRPLVEAR